MKMNFATDKIRRTVLESRIAVKELGADSARKLRSRYADLLAAGWVTDLFYGNPHPLKHDRKGEFALDLAGGKRLTFIPASLDPLVAKDIDWAQVTEISIVYLGDYHGQLQLAS
jgi:proteic killer suppression protein